MVDIKIKKIENSLYLNFNELIEWLELYCITQENKNGKIVIRYIIDSLKDAEDLCQQLTGE